MEYRVIANENPLGSRRWFEDRVNLHLRFGWAVQGAPVAAGVQASDWGQGVHRAHKESLFVFQALVHGRVEPLSHLQSLSAEARAIMDKAAAERSAAEKRRLKDLLAYLEVEADHHASLFPDREAAEEGAELAFSKERLKKALKEWEPA